MPTLSGTVESFDPIDRLGWIQLDDGERTYVSPFDRSRAVEVQVGGFELGLDLQLRCDDCLAPLKQVLGLLHDMTHDAPQDPLFGGTFLAPYLPLRLFACDRTSRCGGPMLGLVVLGWDEPSPRATPQA